MKLFRHYKKFGKNLKCRKVWGKMTFNWEISIGDVIATFSLESVEVLMYILTSVKQKKTKDFAKNANAYNESAKKYNDLMF